jgi:hypothetical protein
MRWYHVPIRTSGEGSEREIEADGQGDPEGVVRRVLGEAGAHLDIEQDPRGEDGRQADCEAALHLIGARHLIAADLELLYVGLVQEDAKRAVGADGEDRADGQAELIAGLTIVVLEGVYVRQGADVDERVGALGRCQGSAEFVEAATEVEASLVAASVGVPDEVAEQVGQRAVLAQQGLGKIRVTSSEPTAESVRSRSPAKRARSAVDSRS